MLNLPIDLGYEGLALLVNRARLEVVIGKRIRLEGIGARALKELMQVTCMDAEGLDQRIDLSRLKAGPDKGSTSNNLSNV